MKNLWSDILNDLIKNINSQYVSTWLEPLKEISIDNETLTLLAPNLFHKDWVSEHYLDIIEDIILKISGKKLKVKIEVSDEILPKETNKKALKKVKKNDNSIGLPLNPRYSFENFVIGTSCQFAHAAALACAEKPGINYNPLFVYGGVGLGKTHLLNAIGHRILKSQNGTKVCYTRTEQFTQEMINSIKYNRMEGFKNKYREETDVLLIDDIQFISGKGKTEEEFFHIFNSLYESRKQIVITSDKFPNEIPNIEDRLRSRFECGLVADIQPPEMETRVAILEKKAELENIELPHDVSIYLASYIKENIRELEGSLIRLAAFSSLTGQEISVELAKKVLKNIIKNQEKKISVDQIQKVVSNFFNIAVSDIKSARKKRVYALPRQIAMYLARKHTKTSFPELGNKFGGKDHTTVLYATKKIEDKIKTDSNLLNVIESIERNLEF